MVHRGNGEYELASHIPGSDANLKGLKNLAAHLRPGGLFLLSVQGVHRNYQKRLPGGVVYSQEVAAESGSETYRMNKQYSFHDNGRLVGREHVSFLCFRNETHHTLMSDGGFQFDSIDPAGQFWI